MNYNKLVRDNIPHIIIANGDKPVTRILNDEEYLDELVKKLDEEHQEFLAEKSLEELADLQEVILAIADTIASREQLETVRAEKVQKRGAFKKKIFLESTQ